jgi:hypothetical protein
MSERLQNDVRISIRTSQANLSKLETIALRLGLTNSRGKFNVSAALNHVLEDVDLRKYKHTRKQRTR